MAGRRLRDQLQDRTETVSGSDTVRRWYMRVQIGHKRREGASIELGKGW